jgi:hypothetical protein
MKRALGFKASRVMVMLELTGIQRKLCSRSSSSSMLQKYGQPLE